MSKAAELAALIGSQTALSNRNLIINGAMQVDQRGTVTGHTGGYGGPDRFSFSRSGAAAVTLSQDTSVPSGQGFSNSFKIDVTTADASLAAGDYAMLRQRIEAQNLQHLLYGTSEAKRVTLQFWVKSPKTGVHILEFIHSDANYYNSQSYTISSANTWQKVTLTFDGYQTTAINNDNGIGFSIQWWLSAGSTYSGGTLSSNTWHNTQANRAVGQVNVTDSTSNNFYLTGIQLEVGEQATPFEHRSYQDDLFACQRYYEGGAYGGGPAGQVYCWRNDSTTRAFPYAGGDFRVIKRAAPTVTIESAQDGTDNRLSGYSSGTNYTVSSISAPSTHKVATYFESSGLPAQAILGYFTADAEL